MNTKTQEALRMIQEHIDMQQYDHAWDRCQQLIEALESQAQPLTKDWIGTALERADKDEAYRKGLIAELAQPLSDDEIVNALGLEYGKIAYGHIKAAINDARAIEKALKERNT